MRQLYEGGSNCLAIGRPVGRLLNLVVLNCKRTSLFPRVLVTEVLMTASTSMLSWELPLVHQRTSELLENKCLASDLNLL